MGSNLTLPSRKIRIQTSTDGRPWADTGTRWAPTSQGKRPQKKPDLGFQLPEL